MKGKYHMKMYMTIAEILNVIHEERVEVEILQALSEWIIKDRATWIVKAMEQKATVRAIGKIANENPSKNNAIEGIKNLCSEDE